MKKLAAAVLFALALATIAAVQAEVQAPEMGHDQLVQMMQAGKVTILDCNGTYRYSQGHIPGAIDVEAEGQNLARLLPADKDAVIVSYCRDLRCHAYLRGVHLARSLGYRNVYHYADGIDGWMMAGGPVQR